MIQVKIKGFEDGQTVERIHRFTPREAQLLADQLLEMLEPVSAD